MIDFENAPTSHPTLREELEAIRERHGELTPEVVFDEAKKKSSPLHSYFEWDKQAGWEKFNLDIAARMIRKVHYVRHPVETKNVAPPVFIRDPAPEKSGYVALAEIARSSTKTAAALDVEIARIESALRRAYSIAEACDSADMLLDRVSAMVAELRPARKAAA
jgi:hypothetical protein